jgi:hypothetical protein
MPEKVNIGKKKRGSFANDVLVAFTNMTVAMKDVAHAIRYNKAIDMHPNPYQAVMDMIRFTEEDLMAAEPPRGPHGPGFQICGHERATPHPLAKELPWQVPLQHVVVPLMVWGRVCKHGGDGVGL